MSVRRRADTVATYRFIAVHLMETLAHWVPTTPELEAKVLFGRHIWDLAQLADQLGQRTSELRVGLHTNRAPTGAFHDQLKRLRALSPTGDRLRGVYDGALPDLGARFSRYLDQTDHLLDEPTVRILEPALVDVGRMRSQRDELLRARPDLNQEDPLEPMWGSEIGPTVEIVDFRPESAEATGAQS